LRGMTAAVVLWSPALPLRSNEAKAEGGT